MTKLAMHQSLTDQHFTPPWILEKVRQHWGQIDLDPCSSKEVNDWSVKATMVFHEDGIELLQMLNPRNPLKFWCNPPSTYSGEAKDWLKVLCNLWTSGKIEQFYFLFFNRENMGKSFIPYNGYIPHVNFGDRLKYWSFNEIAGEFQEGNWSHKNKKKGDCLYSVYPLHKRWGVFRHGTGSPLVFPTKKIALEKAELDNQDIHYRIWTNSPTKQSTLYYFPPLTNSGWCTGQAKFEELFEDCPIDSTIVRTRMPQDLGAK